MDIEDPDIKIISGQRLAALSLIVRASSPINRSRALSGVIERKETSV